MANLAIVRYACAMFLRILGKIVIWFEIALFTFALLVISAYIAFGMH